MINLQSPIVCLRIFAVLSFLTLSLLDVSAQSCGGFDGSPPAGGLVTISNGILCAPQNGPATMQIVANNIDDAGNRALVRFEIDWGDGSAIQTVLGNAGTVTYDAVLHNYTVTVSHIFPSTGANVRCEYTPAVDFFVNSVECNLFATTVPPRFIRWNVDNQNSGILLISEQNTSVTTFEVCAGAETEVYFQDRTTMNCLPDAFNPDDFVNDNDRRRWRQYVYGTTNTITGTVELSDINQALPYLGNVQQHTSATNNSTVPPPAPPLTEKITIPATAQAGEEFVITMRYWNFCNQLSGVPTVGNALNAVTTTARILVVAQPTPPTATNQSVCQGTTPNAFSVTGVPANATVRFYRNNNGVASTTLLGSDATSPYQLPINNYAATATDSLQIGTPGYYKVWASYIPNVAGATNCETVKIPVFIIIRPTISPLPATINGNTQVCSDGSTQYDFSETLNSPIMAPDPAWADDIVGGPTFYTWSWDNNAGISAIAASGATSKELNDVIFNLTDAQFGGPTVTSIVRTLAVNSRYTTGGTPSSVCTTNNTTKAVTVFSTSLGGGVTSPTSTICEGASTAVMTLAGHRGGIVRWERKFNTDPYEPIVNTAPTYSEIPPYGDGTYLYRAMIQNGVCGLVPSTDFTLTVNPTPVTPTITEAGTSDGLTICSGDQTVLQSNNPGGLGVSYSWFKVPDLVTPVQSGVSNTLTLTTAAQSGDYRVQTIGVSPSNCPSALSTPVTVQINALPTATLSGGGSICSGVQAPDVVFTFTGVGPWDLTYSIDGVNQPVENNVASPFNISNPGVGVYAIVSVTDNNAPACNVTAPHINITGSATVSSSAVAPPTVDGFTVTAPVCHDGGTTNPPDAILDLAPNSVVNYDFTYVINGNTHVMNNVASNGAGQITISPPYTDWGSAPGSYVVTITALKNTLTGCAGAVPFDSPLLVVNSRPATPTGAVPGVACSTAANGSPISVAIPAVGFTIVWSSTAAPTFTAAAGTTGGTRGNSFTPTSNATATYHAFMRDDLNPTNCLSAASLSVQHTQDLIPTTTGAGPDQPSLCTGSALMAAQTPNNGGTGAWTLVGAPIPGLVITSPTSPSTTVTGLPQDVPGGAPIITTLRWTVSSALLACTITPDDVILTVNPLPTSVDPAPHLCDEVSGGLVQVTNVNLAAYNASVTNAPTVAWFSNAARTIAVPGNIAPIVDNGTNKIFYFTATGGGCSNIGQLTFTVDALPTALDRNVQICEDAPPGTNAATGIDLRAFENSITGGVGTSDVEWYEDAGLTTLIVPGPGAGSEEDYTVSADKTIFAKVINTASTVVPKCFDVANLIIDYQARPSDNQIKDAGNVVIVDGLAGTYNAPYTVCASNALVLFQIDPSRNPGSTYSWNIPAPSYTLPTPEFEVLTPTTGFFVIIRFNFSTSLPASAYPGGIPITVTETSGSSCGGNPLTVNVNVEASPPQPVITGPASVCSGGVAIYSISNPLAGTYSWTLPPGATITSLPITASTITVQMSTFSGAVNATHSSGSSCTSPPAAAYGVTIVDKPSFTATVNPLCSGQNVSSVVSLTPTVIGTTYNWEIRPGGISGLIGGANVGDFQNGQTNIGNPFPQVLTNTSGLIGSVTYRVTPVGPAPDNCVGTAQDITVIVNPAPVVAPLQTKAICSGEAVNYKILLSPVGLPATTVFTWLTPPVMSDGSTQGTNNLVGLPQSNGIHITDVLVNTTGLPITATYSVIATNGSCSSLPVNVVITVNPAPIITPLQVKTICAGDAIDYKILLTPAGLPATTRFSWPIPSMSGGPAQGSASAAGGVLQSDALHLTDVLINNTGGLITATYNVTATDGLCSSPFVPVIININPSPTATNVNETACSDAIGGNTVLTDLTVLEPSINNGGGVTFSWFQDPGLTIPITPASYTMTDDILVYVEVDNTQCQKVAQVRFDISPTPQVSATITSNYNGITNHVSCFGASNGQITADPATLGTPNYMYSIDGVNFFSSRIFNGLAVLGNPYRITVRDDRGCESQSNALNLDQPDPLTATTLVTSNHFGAEISCPTEDDGEITTTPVGGVGPYTFNILELPGNTTGNGPDPLTGVYTDLRQGTYTVVVKDINNCTVTSNAVTVDDPPVIVANNLTVDNQVTCNGDGDGQISIVASGGFPPSPLFNYTLNQAPFTTNTTGVFIGLAPGSYSVTVRDENNRCPQGSNTVNVTQPSVLTAFASVNSSYAGGSQITCPGEDDGSIKVIANGGNTVLPYTFDLVANTNSTGDATGIYTGLVQGPYTVTVTDSEGCNVTTGVITLNDPLAINPTSFISNPIVCNGASTGQINIIANGGSGALSFERISGAGSPVTNSTGLFPGLAQGTYDFEVSDGNLCIVPIQVTLNQPDPIIASASVISNYNTRHISCPTSDDGVIQVSAIGGSGSFTYTFDNPATPNTSGNLSGIYTRIVAGPGYTFTVRDANAPTCLVVTAPTAVNPPPALGITLAAVTSNYSGQHISCTGEEDAIIDVDAIGGTGAYEYVLNQDPLNLSSPAGVFTGVGVGSYTITVTDVNDCFIVTGTVPVNPYPVITAPASVLTPYAGPREISCHGEADGQIQVTPAGGVGPYTYAITFGPTINNTGDALGASTIYTDLSAGDYRITVSDQNGCDKETSLQTIDQPNELLATADVISNYNEQPVRCFNSSDGIIRVIATGGTTNYNYLLNETGATTTGTGTPPITFTGLPAAPSYTVTVTDINSCTVTTSAITITPPDPLIIFGEVTSDYHGEDISCNGANDAVITVLHTSGGTGTPTYAFDNYPAPGNISGKFSGVFTRVQGPHVGYTLTGTDVNGCTAQTTAIPVGEPLALGVNPIATNATCFNKLDGEIEVNPTGGTGNFLVDFNYMLLEDAGNTSGATDGTFDGLRSGSYRIRITDQNGCIFTTPSPGVNVGQPADILISIDITSNYGALGTDISCVGADDGQVSVRAAISGGTDAGGNAGSGIGDYTYTIDPPDNTTGATTGVFTGLSDKLYTITAEDASANNCNKTSLPVVLIEPIPLYEGFVGASQNICINQDAPAQFTVITEAAGENGSYAYQWQESLSPTGPFNDIAGATAKEYQVPATPALTQTTHYRRMTTASSASPACASIPTQVLTITVKELPTATIENQDPVCQGSPFLLDFTFPDGEAPFTFVYNDGVNPPVNRIGATVTPIFVNDYQQALTYTITSLVDRNGCQALLPIASRTVQIIDVDADFNITSPNPQCSGSEFRFSYNNDPGVAYNFAWPDGTNTLIPAGTGTGTTQKTLTSFNSDTNSDLPIVFTATHPQCVPLTTSKLVTIYPAIIPNIVTNPTTLCSGTPITVTNLTQGGDDHDWRIVRMSDGAVIQSRLDQANPDSQTFTIDNDLASALNPDTYEIRYTINNTATNGGCNDQVIVPVRVYREVVASFTKPAPPVWTAMGVDMTFVNTSTPIHPDFQYSWTFVSSATPNAFVGQDPPTIHFDQPGLNKRVRLVASNPTALADPALLNGCQSVDEYVFSILIPPLAAEFDHIPETTCLPTTIVITSNTSTGDLHQWRILNQSGVEVMKSNEVTPSFQITSPGEYSIFLTTSNSLNAATPVTKGPEIVKVYASPVAIFEARPTVVYVPDTQLQVFNMSSSAIDPISATSYPIEYRWYFGDGTDTLSTADSPDNFEPSHFYINEGMYDIALLAINDHGDGAVCKDTAVQRIQAKAAGFTRVPNAFTPSPNGPTGGVGAGGNSVNDVFLPVAKGIVSFQMQIFDRWGNLVFESKDKTIGWDGYDRNGNLLPAGVYVYKLNLQLSNDQRTTQIGDVTLIR